MLERADMLKARPEGCSVLRSAEGAEQRKMGDDLLSHGVYPAVPSALAGLTSLFGMGRGVSPPPSSPFQRSGKYSVVKPSKWRLTFENRIARTVKVSSSPRLISTTRLHTSLHLHLWPINLV